MKRDQTQKTIRFNARSGILQALLQPFVFVHCFEKENAFSFLFFFFNLEKNLPFRMCVPYKKEHERAFLLLPS